MRYVPADGAFQVLSVMIATGLLVFSGCGGESAREKLAEKSIEGALEQGGGKADVDLEKDKATISTPDGKTEISFGEQTWPTDLPAGVPAFTLGRIKGVNRSEQDGKKSWNIVLEEVGDGALEDYTKKLKAGDWSLMSSMTAGAGGMVQATKDDLMIVVMVNAEQRVASIGVAPQGE